MKVKIVNIVPLPENEWGEHSPEITVELPSGERIKIHVYDHFTGPLSPTRASKQVREQIASAVLLHQNRIVLADAAKKLGTEFEVEPEGAE